MAIPYDGRPKINVPPDQCAEKLKEALWIMHKLRKYKKIWDVSYGSNNRLNLQLWEDKADKFLESVIEKPL